MGALQKLPNIGPELERLLNKAGIDTPEALIALGARDAFFRLKAVDPTACHSKLYAIGGAVKGVRWHDLTPGEKKELNEIFKALDG